MLFDVEELLKKKPGPICILRHQKVADAIAIMVKNDYSQLPVVNQNHTLVGIISEQSIARLMARLEAKINILDLQVDHCQVEAVKIDRDRSVFDVLPLLRENYAVIITENDRPIGVLTNYDLVDFFKNYSEGIIDIQDIELTLRELFLSVFPDVEQQKLAAKKATGRGKELRKWEFSDYQKILTYEEYWLSFFSKVFENKDLMLSNIDHTRLIRNKQAHFLEGRNVQQLNADELAFLKYVKHWLDTRPRLPQVVKDVVRIEQIPEQIKKAHMAGNKYTRLAEFLSEQKDRQIQLGFDQVAKLVGGMPPSAYNHRAWWANDRVGHVQSKEWLRVGWRVRDVDFENQRVIFAKENVDPELE